LAIASIVSAALALVAATLLGSMGMLTTELLVEPAHFNSQARSSDSNPYHSP